MGTRILLLGWPIVSMQSIIAVISSKIFTRPGLYNFNLRINDEKKCILIYLWFFISSCCVPGKTCLAPQLPNMAMLTSAHICFSMLVSVAKWTALNRASDVGAIPALQLPPPCAQLRRCDSWYSKRESKWSGLGLKSNLTAPWWSSAMKGRGLFHELRSQSSGEVSLPTTYLGNPVSMTRWGVWCDLIC